MIFLSIFGSQHCFKILKFMIVYSELKTAYVSAVSGGHYEKDRVSDAKFISAKNNIGPKMCVNYCLMLSTCNALNYFHSELKCECLLEVNPEMNLRYNKGSYFTKIHNWIRSANSCYPNPCKSQTERTKCVEINQHEYICIELEKCPLGWLKFKNKCYFLSDITLAWLNAKNYCNSINTILAEPHTTDEINIIKSAAMNKGYSFWIGGTDSQKQSRWIWASSETQIFNSDWASGQPNNYGGIQDCINLHTVLNFKWNDYDCSYPFRFICEKILE